MYDPAQIHTYSEQLSYIAADKYIAIASFTAVPEILPKDLSLPRIIQISILLHPLGTVLRAAGNVISSCRHVSQID